MIDLGIAFISTHINGVVNDTAIAFYVGVCYQRSCRTSIHTDRTTLQSPVSIAIIAASSDRCRIDKHRIIDIIASAVGYVQGDIAISYDAAFYSRIMHIVIIIKFGSFYIYVSCHITFYPISPYYGVIYRVIIHRATTYICCEVIDDGRVIMFSSGIRITISSAAFSSFCSAIFSVCYSAIVIKQ